MYVPFYNAQGFLAAPLSKSGGAMLLDPQLTAKLNILEGQYTYLALDNGLAVEIVKIWGRQNNKFYIERGLDNTEAQSYVSGAKVYYTLTQAEIESYISAAPLTILPTGGIVIENGVLGYTDIELDVVGNLEAVGQLSLTRLPEYGCCDGGSAPSEIPRKPYWYTSPLYPVDYDEAYRARYSILGIGSYEMPKDAMAMKYSIVALAMRSILQAYTISEAYHLTYQLLQGNIRDILKPYVVPVFPPDPVTGLPSQNESEAITLGYSFRTGSIRVAQVRHDLPSEAYQMQYNLMSGSLA